MKEIIENLRARSRDLARRSTIRYWDWRADTHATQPGQSRHLDRWRAVFAESFPTEPAREVLDAGTGTGFCALPLARMGHRVTAVDLSAGMISGTRQAALDEGLEISFVRADATAPHLTPESFDGVIARNLLWTLPHPAATLRLWHELLRPGGSLLVSDGLWNPPRRSLGRVLSGLSPNVKDRSGLRFEASYLWARRGLPLYSGLDAARAERMLEDSGFSGMERREGIFDEDPFELPDSGFFILLARKPVGADKPC